MVPVDPVARLVEAAADRSGTEAFGLLMAEARTISSLGPLGSVRARTTHVAGRHRRNLRRRTVLRQ